MAGPLLPTTAKRLSDHFGATVIGSPDRAVEKLSPLSGAGDGCLTFCGSAKYAQFMEGAKGAVIFTRKEWVRENLLLTYLVVENPQAAFAEIAGSFNAEWATVPGISPLATVAEGAWIATDATVGPFAVVEDGATVGSGTFIGAQSIVGAGTRIGSNCRIHPRVTLFPRVVLGNRVQIFSGSVIGSDGFGIFGGEAGKLTEMPQVGTVVIGDDVRIGANCTIDRATIGETRIGNGVKMDNLVQVGHNCVIKDNSILCAQVALGGSVTVEKNVILGGQAGIGHGVTIGENARLGGQAGVSTDVEGDQTYSFSPALPVRLAHQIHRYTLKLPELFKRVRALEKMKETTPETLDP